MGILQTTLEKVKEMVAPEKIKSRQTSTGGTGDTPTDTLETDSEVERLSQYVDKDNLKKIINVRSGIKHGVDHIGDIKDCDFFHTLRNAPKYAKEKAARVLVKLFAKENLKDIIKTKVGKEIKGKILSKNVYIKEVSYKRGEKIISYLQARSLKTGCVVSYHGAMSLLGKME